MQKLAVNPYRERVDFSRIKARIPVPNLIEIQRKSYDRFLQMNLLATERQDLGLQAVFKSIFPITDFRENCELQFVEYAIGVWECKCGKLEGLSHLRRKCTSCGASLRTNPLGEREIACHSCGKGNENRGSVCDTCGDSVALKLKYDMEECQERGMTYSVPLKVTIRLTVYDKDPETNVRSIRDIKEQEVYFGDIPLMTDNGTFIVNGTERVIVSQLHRSPGVFFHAVDKNSYLAQIIPYRGSWVEFEFDQKNLLYVRIDRKRKFLATVFLRALGLKSDEDILREFHRVDTLTLQGGKLYLPVTKELMGRRLSQDITSLNGQDIVVAGGKRITKLAFDKIEKAGITEVELTARDLDGAFSVADVVNTDTGEVLVDCNDALPSDILAMLVENNIDLLEVFYPEVEDVGTIMSLTAKKDTVRSSEEALIEIYRRLRPGDPPTLDSSRHLFQGMFFNSQKYDFSRVGRLKLNTKLSLEEGEGGLEQRLLESRDFFAVIRYLLRLPRSVGTVDDIDHLGNRRVRSVGELLREPVPHRPRPDGARHQRKDERLSGDGDRHAARPHQRQAGDGRQSASSSAPRSSRSSWTRRIRCRRSHIRGVFRRSGPAVSLVSAPASRCATCTRRTMAASAPSRRPRVRILGSSARSPAMRASTSTGSSRAPTRESSTAA